MKNYNGFEDLEVWKEAREFRKLISQTTKKFPIEERYELTKQIKRSSRSVTANIAEGHGRFYYQEGARFSRTSRGSLKETLDHLYVALDEGYIKEQELETLKTRYSHCLKLLNGYISYLESKNK